MIPAIVFLPLLGSSWPAPISLVGGPQPLPRCGAVRDDHHAPLMQHVHVQW